MYKLYVIYKKYWNIYANVYNVNITIDCSGEKKNESQQKYPFYSKNNGIQTADITRLQTVEIHKKARIDT